MLKALDLFIYGLISFSRTYFTISAHSFLSTEVISIPTKTVVVALPFHQTVFCATPIPLATTTLVAAHIESLDGHPTVQKKLNESKKGVLIAGRKFQTYC